MDEQVAQDQLVTCGACKKSQPRDAFHKSSVRRSGLEYACKSCKRANYLKNRDAILAKRMAAYRADPAAAYQRARAYRQGSEKAHAKYLAYLRQYRETNLDRKRESDREYYQANKEARAAYYQAYYSENRDKYVARSGSARAAKALRTPRWLTADDLASIALRYTEAKTMSAVTGAPHHVDHIVPLHGESVSGLHVPWNLRVITAKHNFFKSNKFIGALALAPRASCSPAPAQDAATRTFGHDQSAGSHPHAEPARRTLRHPSDATPLTSEERPSGP